MELKGTHKKYLKGLAHSLNPVVLVGINAIEEPVINAINENLISHELIKIKFIKFKKEKDILLEEILKKTKATLVSVIGNVAILYRQNLEPEKRKILF